MELLDRFMPAYDVVSRHSEVVHAPPARVYANIREANLGRSAVVRVLFALRSLPALFARRKKPRGLALSLAAMERNGFALLDERAPTELVFGLVGQFWTAGGNLQRIDRAAFESCTDPAFARAIWHFGCVPHEGGTLLTTETRVQCNGDAARERFLRYWRIIGPFSGLIRVHVLRAIKQQAEAAQAALTTPS